MDEKKLQVGDWVKLIYRQDLITERGYGGITGKVYRISKLISYPGGVFDYELEGVVQLKDCGRYPEGRTNKWGDWCLEKVEPLVAYMLNLEDDERRASTEA